VLYYKKPELILSVNCDFLQMSKLKRHYHFCSVRQQDPSVYTWFTARNKSNLMKKKNEKSRALDVVLVPYFVDLVPDLSGVLSCFTNFLKGFSHYF